MNHRRGTLNRKKFSDNIFFNVKKSFRDGVIFFFFGERNDFFFLLNGDDSLIMKAVVFFFVRYGLKNRFILWRTIKETKS